MESFVENFEAVKPALPGAAIPWVGSLRTEAAARFAGSGLPTRKLEAWKYTDLSPLRQIAWRGVQAEDLAARIDFSPPSSPLGFLGSALFSCTVGLGRTCGSSRVCRRR